MHVFKHPKYYEEMRQRAKKFQREAASAKPQATSVKHQAGPGAGCKPQALRGKAQASSRKRQAP